MEQFVINIGRQLGSGGRTVGEIIARRLGVKLYDKELINLAARESGICPEFFEKADEKESRGVISTVVGYLRAPFVGDDGGVTNVLSNDALFKIQSDVIRAVAARESAVFVGRCAITSCARIRAASMSSSRPTMPTASAASAAGRDAPRRRPAR